MTFEVSLDEEAFGDGILVLAEVMNLEIKLNNAVNDILRSSGYILEMVNNNKKSSNLITGSNNQLITPTIISQLSMNINNFDEILDDTVSKLNEGRWCVEQILENKHKQEEKLREEERLKKIKEEEEEQKRREKAEKKRRDDEARERALKEAQTKKEQEDKEREEKGRQEKESKAREDQKKQEELKQKDASGRMISDEPSLDMFISPGFDFNDLQTDDSKDLPDIPNPADILSSISYKDADSKNSDPSNIDDLDMNKLLGNDESLLDGLNVSLLDQGNLDSTSNNAPMDDEFDVDNFLNQFGGLD